MGARDEDGNVEADGVPPEFRETVQRVKNIASRSSDQEIYTMLVACKMNEDDATGRLLPQDTSREILNLNRDQKKEDTSGSSSQRVDHDVGQGGGNKSNSDGNRMQNNYLCGFLKLISGLGSETSNVQGTSTHLAGSSTTSGTLGPFISDSTNAETRSVPVSAVEAVPSSSNPSSSDDTNGERRILPISSGKAVSSLAAPPPWLISAGGSGVSGKRTMADVVKGINKAPVEDTTNPISNAFTESAAGRYQLGESSRSVPSSSNPFSNTFTGSAAGRELGESSTASNQEHNQTTNPSSSVVTSLEQLYGLPSDFYYGDYAAEAAQRGLNKILNPEAAPWEPSPQMQNSSTLPDARAYFSVPPGIPHYHYQPPPPPCFYLPILPLPYGPPLYSPPPYGPPPYCPPPYGPPPYAFGTSRGNAADVSSNRFPPSQHQRGNSNVWSQLNQQSPSFTLSQQQQEGEQQSNRRSGPYHQSPNQQNSRRDPSDQTQR